MPPPDDWLLNIGIKIQDIVAGLFGSLVDIIYSMIKGHKHYSPATAAGSMVIGMLIANYSTEPIIPLVYKLYPGAACFLVGYSSMRICQWAIAYTKAKLPKPIKETTDD